MVTVTDLFHMMDPSGDPQNVNFDEPVSTFDSRYLLDLLLTPTKGNVIVGDGANWIVIGVGADTEVLTADSGEASGVKWDTGGGGADEVGVDHIHGLSRWNADGGATFNLPDIAEYLELVFDDGFLVAPSTLALSADGSQIVFDVAPAAASIVVASYVILRI